MSRIILSRHSDGTEKMVVGWDHPAGGAFWQEFNLEINPESGRPFWEEDDNWQEVTRHGGMFPGIPLNQFRQSVPEDLRPLITDEVMGMIEVHADDPNSGRIPPIDWSNNVQDSRQ